MCVIDERLQRIIFASLSIGVDARHSSPKMLEPPRQWEEAKITKHEVRVYGLHSPRASMAYLCMRCPHTNARGGLRLRRVRRADAQRGDQSRGWKPTRRHKARLAAFGMRVWSSTREGGRSAAYASEGGRRLCGGSAIQDQRRSGHRVGDRPGRDDARRRSQVRERRLRDQGLKTDMTRLREKTT